MTARVVRMLSVAMLCAACGGSDPASPDGGEDVPGDGGMDAVGDATEDADAADPERLAPEIGTGDHSPESVTFELVVGDDRLDRPTGLAFAKDRPNDLWIVNQEEEDCAFSNDGWTIVNDLGTSDEWVASYCDDSLHFLSNPTSLSFSDDSAVGTCQDSVNTYEGMQAADYWMGPVVWTTDRELFEGGAGSHYDMAHESPHCMGIVWTNDHVWWVFNNHNKAIDRVNFHDWHPDGTSGLAGDDHTDGEVFRYASGEVEGTPGVPSHMAFNPDDGFIYISDTGNQRVVRLDSTADDCSSGEGYFGEMEFNNCDAQLEEVVPEGVLGMPSGIVVHNGFVYIADHLTGIIHAYTVDGEAANWLDTGVGAQALTGLAMSSDGVLYFLDGLHDELVRIVP